MKRKRKKLKRLAAAALLLLLLLILAVGAAYAVTYFLRGERESQPRISRTSHSASAAPSARRTLKVMALNLAHGRRDGAHQLLQSAATISSNLDEVARVLSRVSPDVVGLQEADGASFWSGGFDHVDYLAERSNFLYFARAEHVKGPKLSYGTALLSTLPLEKARSVTFAPSPPTPSKGFLVATLGWPVATGGTRKVDVVSVHLDFSRQSVRERQVDEIIQKMSPRQRPLIVAGDFNCAWTSEESTLRTLARKLDLKTFRPEAPDLNTFPSSPRRLDWILISDELEFRTCEVLPDILSDHLAVVAEIAFTGSVERRSSRR